MNEILSAVFTLGALGLLFGAVLAVSSKLFAVERDESNEPLIDVEAAENKRMTALVKCSGGVRAKRKFEYAGINDCVAATQISGGLLECAYGCVGLGTCVSSCSFGAISIVDEVAVIDYDKCHGCERCVLSCPKNIIALIPYDADVHVCCSSVDKGGALRKICEIGCVSCRMCEKVCKHGAIQVNDSLAVIDYGKCTGCGDCAEKCPRKLISDANLDKGPKPIDSDNAQNASDITE